MRLKYTNWNVYLTIDERVFGFASIFRSLDEIQLYRSCLTLVLDTFQAFIELSDAISAKTAIEVCCSIKVNLYEGL